VKRLHTRLLLILLGVLLSFSLHSMNLDESKWLARKKEITKSFLIPPEETMEDVNDEWEEIRTLWAEELELDNKPDEQNYILSLSDGGIADWLLDVEISKAWGGWVNSGRGYEYNKDAILKSSLVLFKAGRLMSSLHLLRQSLLLLCFECEGMRRYRKFSGERVSPVKYNKVVSGLNEEKAKIRGLIKKVREKAKNKSDFDKWLLVKAEAKALYEEDIRLHKYYSKGKHKKKIEHFVRKVLRRLKRFLFADGADKVKIISFDLKKDRLRVKRFFKNGDVSDVCFVCKKWKTEEVLIKANGWE